MKDRSDLTELLGELFAAQQLAVLSTLNEGQPYGNLVAFAATDEFRHLIFVTNRNTRKYTNLKGNRKVALLIDSRTNQISDFHKAVAVTAIGTAEEITGNERELLARVYIAKHPHLGEFINRPDSAVMKITVSDYIVAGFNKTQSLQLGD
jgi:nitroimidazol reductase NimA-like FMN-containing flavoprotein (pyridoxamine 5'-phosphate oxidase superfamily)